MEGLWLVSYLILWIFVLLQTALLVALLRHIGNLRLWLREAGVLQDSVAYEEGPPIGEKLEKLSEVLKFDGRESSFKLHDQKGKLLIFVPAGFFGCDDLIDAIKRFDEKYADDYQTLIVSFTPAEPEQFEVALQRGINTPILTEYGWQVAELCNVVTAPYAIMLDPYYVVYAKLTVSHTNRLDELIEMYRKNGSHS